uniref:Ribosomal RNA small subunit methyltransferase NEP1 n=1 Tax=Anthurium amnicola TaxID=1678845 RepID=A0A1D1XI87_9ARAE
MVRPYAVKWLKRKRKKGAAAGAAAAGDVEEERRFEAEERGQEEEEGVEEKRRRVPASSAVATTPEEERMVEANAEGGLPVDPRGADEGDPLQALPGLPLVEPCDQRPKPGVIFVLEKASLRVGKIGKTETILNADDHANFLKKKGSNPADFRPDIVHQALLAILDSPLNKAGRLQALYVKTDDGELIDVKPYVRLPRTFKRFCGLMYQLKNKTSIRATGKREKLFRMISNPVTKHLPVNSRKIGLSYSSQKLVRVQDYVAAAGDDVTLVFVVGAMAHGKIEADYTDDFISVSGYPLSAACCISRICNVLEQRWNIL